MISGIVESMKTELGLFISTFTTLFVIIDPFGNLPVFMSLTKDLPKKQRQTVAWQANLLAIIILFVFGFFGFQLFGLLGISPAALQISGGLLLLIVALQLLTGAEGTVGEEGGSLNIAAVPLGTPLLAGPGAIVALMVAMGHAGQHPLSVIAVTGGTLAVMFTSWLAMHFATPIIRFLGDSGVAVMTRLAGMLLAAIAVELMISGVISVVQDVAKTL
ncbi:MarC family protein [uncultured Mobiluncus sp.]|uniref:MarC family protein n=1 Tax=uncultured Mobiluncus sp. TaxID=293425 RepID=UPI002601AD47|nr:MarC family protein [uncultured Mobiluncus sp.]